MMDKKDQRRLIKIVYFDEDSASDLVDMAAGGRETASTEESRGRTADLEAKATAKAAAKFNWLPFFGGSVEASAAAGASAVGRSFLNKTLSNTILTDYLEKLESLDGVEVLSGYSVKAVKDSAAFMKTYTPYLVMLKMDELPVNLGALGAALEAAKGYYELVGENGQGDRRIFRFNIQAFRNNYGLADLGRMRLVFDAVLVGHAKQSSLTMKAELAPDAEEPPTGLEIVDGSNAVHETSLPVYDVILAGVVRDG